MLVSMLNGTFLHAILIGHWIDQLNSKSLDMIDESSTAEKADIKESLSNDDTLDDARGLNNDELISLSKCYVTIFNVYHAMN